MSTKFGSALTLKAHDIIRGKQMENEPEVQVIYFTDSLWKSYVRDYLTCFAPDAKALAQ